jgi:uncharacterized membrane protein YhaH (DUF805 family)
MSTLNFFFSFRGRLSRFGYWSVLFAGLLIGFAMAVVLTPFNSWIFGTDHTLFKQLFILAAAAFLFASYLSILSASIRRLHDLNFSGWWSLLLMIFTFLGLFFLGCIPGDAGKKRFGPAPAS